MKRYYLLILIIGCIISCKTEKLDTKKISQQIDKRIEILNSSYKFSVIPENLQDNNFDKLKSQIEKIVSESDIDLQINHEIVKNLFSNYDIDFVDKSESKTDFIYNIMIGLDDLIFKYLPSRLNFSDYNVIVVPNKTQIISGDTVKARIYLTVSDSLYDPEFKFLDCDSKGKVTNVYNLPIYNGIGEFNMVARKKGLSKRRGFVIYSTELGSKDTIDWIYEFEVK